MLDRTGLRVEVWRAWHRTWGSRLMQAVAGAFTLLLVAAWFTIPLPPGAVHAELSRLRTASDVVTLALMVLAFLAAFRVLSPDLNEAFDSLSERGGSRPLTFAAGRVLAAGGGLALTAAVLAIVIEGLDLNGQYEAQELVHMVVLLANALAVFLLAGLLIAAFGRIAGVLAAFVLFNIGADAAYHPLIGTAVIDQSVTLNQFPVREGHAVWGADLIQVSSLLDVQLYLVYALVAAGLFYLVCRMRARQARTRLRPTTWTAPRLVDDRSMRRQ
ncbi:MAG: hypothetical protein E6I69_04925 [Chloroflexi bacterium]|nr:MAG: hypothetical protein E6I69_04925 [Chloroflexota bacterium]